MIKVRKSEARGYADHGWLKARHSFSFSEYYDPEHMGFSALRVINEDRIAGGMGFGTHPHKDMEIVTYVLAGALEHKDSMGHSEVLKPGEVQYMCAGTGVRHSEFNPIADKECHLLQIWLLPDKGGYTPEYQQKDFSKQIRDAHVTLVVSPDGRDGSLKIHQDANLYVLRAAKNDKLKLPNQPGRRGWAQIIEGELDASAANLPALSAGDALAITDEKPLEFVVKADVHLLFFDLP